MHGLDPAPLVLVVDDEATVIRLLQIHLQLAGLRCATAASAVDALEIIDSVRPDAIVSDIMMPVVDGLEFCRRLRAAGNQVPVLLLSARQRDAVVDDFLTTDGVLFLSKPFGAADLHAALASMLRTQSLPARGIAVESDVRGAVA